MSDELPLKAWMVFAPEGAAFPASMTPDSEWSIRHFLYSQARPGGKAYQWDHYEAKGYTVRKVVVRAEDWETEGGE